MNIIDFLIQLFLGLSYIVSLPYYLFLAFWSYIPTFIQTIFIVVPLLIAVAFFTLAERKFLALVQRRRGPNVVGFLGLLQPFADGYKLLTKEKVHPNSSQAPIFLVSPMLGFCLSFVAYSNIPLAKYSALVEINVGLIFIVSSSIFGVLSVILAGWSSNSKFSFLGALRSAAQMISYELSMGFMLLCVVILSGTFDLCHIVNMQQDLWFVVIFSPLSILFLGALLAETNRHPFDLPEAESELVCGFSTEYSGMCFALFSLAEYANMFTMACLHTILFLGGWFPPFAFLNFLPGSFWFSIKVSLFVGFYSWMRAGLPRYTYRHLMDLGWKVFLPISLGYFTFTLCIAACLDILPK